MRILSINNSADSYGASRSLLRLLEHLVSVGHDVHLVLPGPGFLSASLESSGVKINVCPHLAIIDRSAIRSFRGICCFPVNFFISVIWLSAFILRNKISVVHTNVATVPSAAAAAFLTRRPHAWHVRETFDEFGRVWKLYRRYICGLSDCVIAISEYVRRQFDSACISRVEVIYNGMSSGTSVDRRSADLEKIRRFRNRFPSAEILVGMVGRIKWHRKGQEVLVRAAHLLRDSCANVKYIIVGSATRENEDHAVRLRALIEELGLGDRFIFAGEIEDMPPVYAAFDLTVVPSIHPEPFGMVVVESMAQGTPVIGSRCGGIQEQIVDGVSGLLFTPGDHRELAERLQRLISDRELRRQLSDGCRARVLEKFSEDEELASIERVFQEISNSPRP